MIGYILLQQMKLSSKNLGVLWIFLFLGLVIGSLAWEVLERLLNQVGMEVALSIGPIGFDLSVLALSLEINPGSFAGLVAGFLLFKYS